MNANPSPRRGTIVPVQGKSLLKGEAMRRVQILAAAQKDPNEKSEISGATYHH